MRQILSRGRGERGTRADPSVSAAVSRVYPCVFLFVKVERQARYTHMCQRLPRPRWCLFSICLFPFWSGFGCWTRQAVDVDSTRILSWTMLYQVQVVLNTVSYTCSDGRRVRGLRLCPDTRHASLHRNKISRMRTIAGSGEYKCAENAATSRPWNALCWLLVAMICVGFQSCTFLSSNIFAFERGPAAAVALTHRSRHM